MSKEINLLKQNSEALMAEGERREAKMMAGEGVDKFMPMDSVQE